MTFLDPLQDLPPHVANHPLVAPLNPEQRRAVLCTDGPLLVLAGAGSGKTRVITHRIAWLIAACNVAPWQILAMTFTNKAAGEMRERVGHRLGGAANDIWLGTFHSMGVRLLRQLADQAGLRSGFSIYDTDDQLKMIGRAMKALQLSENTHKPKHFAWFIDRAKNRCLLPGDPRLAREIDSSEGQRALQVYAEYEKQMRLANAVDFGDLLLRPVQVLANDPELARQVSARFRYVLVDEFQDTNFAQFELLKILTQVHGNLCVVGDDDQSIYSWRGAEVDNILKFPDKFANTTVIKLERNYRSTSTILQASTAVVQHNRERHGKVLWTEAGAGDKLRLHVAGTDRDEADFVARQIEKLRDAYPLSEFAVFYRTNALSRQLEEAMRRFRLPYVLIGGQRFYERAEVKDALAWCRLLVNTEDSAGWLRAVVSPRRGIGDTTIDRVVEYAHLRQLSLPSACAAMLRTGDAGKARDKLRAFQDLVERLRDGIEGKRADVVGRLVLDKTGLRQALVSEHSIEAESRLENLEQLLGAMAEHADTAPDPSLRAYLDQVALVADTDALGSTAKVSLMTMHAAKGLEYDVAFIVGLEDGLLPHAMVVKESAEPRDIEEERRLFYVAMTRARKKLYLTRARMRRKFGGAEMPSEPSPFLADVPRELVEVDHAPEHAGTSWGGRAGAWSTGAGGSAWGAGASSTSGAGSAARTAGWRAPPGGTAARPGAWTRPAGVDPGPRHLGDDEPVVDRTSGDGYAPGSKVTHKVFGPGKVLAVDGYGDQAHLTVQFAKVGVKKLVARYVQPG
ncbi:MAG: ATP-dependent helicase [Myxococcota bacterium]